MLVISHNDRQKQTYPFLLFMMSLQQKYNKIGGLVLKFGLHTYTLEQRIDEIKVCIANEMWQSALGLSLTIPDICGQIKYGKIRVNERYTQWFNKFVEHHYIYTEYHSNRTETPPYFTGDMCYELRCAFLHSGDDATNKVSNKIKYKFYLRTTSVDTIRLNDEDNIDCVYIDIVSLCNNICNGALRFFDEWEKPEDFTSRTCYWLDLKEFNSDYERLP